MKKILLSLSLLCKPKLFLSVGLSLSLSLCIAQSVGLGTTTPDSSAILDLSSSSKGILIPRMTTVQRDRIVEPATGLQVYNTDDRTLDIYDGEKWIQIGGAKNGNQSRMMSDTIWTLQGDDIYTIPSENVGIGTTDPHESAVLDLSSTSQGILMPRMNTAQRDAIVAPATGLQIINLDDNCVDLFDGVNWVKNCGLQIMGLDTMPEGWTKRANVGPDVREDAFGFSIGDKGFIGTGRNISTVFQDFWEYNSSTNVWTQKANFGGGQRYDAVGFAIGNKGYAGTGEFGSYHNDFYEYNPANNVWTMLNSFDGEARSEAVGFELNGKGYVGTGKSGPALRDFWEYDVASDTWSIRDTFESLGRYDAIGFSINGKGYIGLGRENATPYGDILPYDPVTNDWGTAIIFPASPTYAGVGFAIGSQALIGGGYHLGSPRFWLYDPLNNIWDETELMPGSTNTRLNAVGFAIGNSGFVGTGYANGYKNDFWEFNPQRTHAQVQHPITSSPTVNTNDGIWTRKYDYVYNSTPANIGIGIQHPSNALDIQMEHARTGTHPVGLPLYVTGNFGETSGVEFRHYNGTQGIGLGCNTVYAAGTNTDQDLGVIARGNGNLRFTTGAQERMRIIGNGNVGIGTAVPKTKMHITGGSTAGLTESTGYAVLGSTAGTNIVLDDNEILARNNGAASNLILQEEGGNIGVGNGAPVSKLHVFGTTEATTTANGLTQWGASNAANIVLDNNEILARNNGAASNLILQEEGGNVGVGSGTPVSKLHVVGTTDATLTANGLTQWGASNAANIVLDNNEILARSNGGTSNLMLQEEGGNVGIGSVTPTSKLHVVGTTDAALNTHGIAQLGATNAANIVMDNNEIQARSNGAAANFLLQEDGGNVGIGIAPNERLEVGGDARAFFGNGGGASRKGLLIDGIEGSNASRLEAYNYHPNNPTGRDLVINTIGGGNVGINVAVPDEKLHVVGNAKVTGNLVIGGTIPNDGFSAPDFENGFENYLPGTYAPAGYYRDKENRVHLRGTINSAQSGWYNVTLFILPEAFRPSKTVRFLAPLGVYGHCHIEINQYGVVYAVAAAVEGAISLDGISFRIGQ